MNEPRPGDTHLRPTISIDLSHLIATPGEKAVGHDKVEGSDGPSGLG